MGTEERSFNSDIAARGNPRCYFRVSFLERERAGASLTVIDRAWKLRGTGEGQTRILGLLVVGCSLQPPDCKTCSSVGIGHEAPRSCGRHRPSMGRLQFGAGTWCPAIGAGADTDGFRRIARLTTIIADWGSIQRWARPVPKTVPLEAPTNLASLENGGACHNPSELPRAVAVSCSSIRV
jgi:hypothetical protein